MAVNFVCTKGWFEQNVISHLGLNVDVESGSTYILCETPSDLNVLSQNVYGDKISPASVSTILYV